MDRSKILSRTTEIFADILDKEDLVLVEATTADDVKEWDSLSHVRLLISLEREFGIRFGAAEVQTPRNVGELVDLIQRKI